MVDSAKKPLGIGLHIGSRIYFAIRSGCLKVIGAQGHYRGHILRLECRNVASVPVFEGPSHRLGFVPHDSPIVLEFNLALSR